MVMCDSGMRRMDELRVGDRCLDAAGDLSPIFLITHADPMATGTFLRLHTELNQTLELTEGHLLPVKGVATRGGRVRVGDLLATVRGSGRVIRIERERRQGVFSAARRSPNSVPIALALSPSYARSGTRAAVTLHLNPGHPHRFQRRT